MSSLQQAGLGELFFVESTPGQPNARSVIGFVEDTSFSVDRGFHDSPFETRITSSTPGASIVYTMDGDGAVDFVDFNVLANNFTLSGKR